MSQVFRNTPWKSLAPTQIAINARGISPRMKQKDCEKRKEKERSKIWGKEKKKDRFKPIGSGGCEAKGIARRGEDGKGARNSILILLAAPPRVELASAELHGRYITGNRIYKCNQQLRPAMRPTLLVMALANRIAIKSTATSATKAGYFFGFCWILGTCYEDKWRATSSKSRRDFRKLM